MLGHLKKERSLELGYQHKIINLELFNIIFIPENYVKSNNQENFIIPYSLVRYCSLRNLNTSLTQAINTISPIKIWYSGDLIIVFYEKLRCSSNRYISSLSTKCKSKVFSDFCIKNETKQNINPTQIVILLFTEKKIKYFYSKDDTEQQCISAKKKCLFKLSKRSSEKKWLWDLITAIRELE
ncbi:hypothetical protein BpHYR1_038057 [Brachionus plicatilis]|uniref:Uncharacterized protein n=1 Tax=Brachionus plicatilis TaxID=10195 RepID=A0A3M7PTT2_BRAPC|nr:hypothetical protein BpHYR1_038057 [Brachionus plicatilis]